MTNYLGGFLLTLMPALRAANAPRIVNVASEAHRSGRIDFANLELERGYGAYRAYANTKLAGALHARARAPGARDRRQRRAPRHDRDRHLASRAGPGAAVDPDPAAEAGEGRGSRGAARGRAGLRGVSGRYFDRFREATPSEAARNDADARRLWEVSELAVGVES